MSDPADSMADAVEAAGDDGGHGAKSAAGETTQTDSSPTVATCSTSQCDRRVATGFTTCCRTCVQSKGKDHGPICRRDFAEVEKAGDVAARAVEAAEDREPDSAEGNTDLGDRKQHPVFDTPIEIELTK